MSFYGTHKPKSPLQPLPHGGEDGAPYGTQALPLPRQRAACKTQPLLHKQKITLGLIRSKTSPEGSSGSGFPTDALRGWEGHQQQAQHKHSLEGNGKICAFQSPHPSSPSTLPSDKGLQTSTKVLGCVFFFPPFLPICAVQSNGHPGCKTPPTHPHSPNPPTQPHCCTVPSPLSTTADEEW